MGKNKHYCDFCDVLLTHNSIAVRKAHNAGRNHLANVRDYYTQAINENPPLTQRIFDSVLQSYAEQGLPPPQQQQMAGPPSMLFGSGPLSGQGPNMFSRPPPHMQGGMGGNGLPPHMQGGMGGNGPPPHMQSGMGGNGFPPNGYARGPPPGYGGGGGPGPDSNR
ncbi:unnamed protein product [Tilletia controversa]|uniref:Matrin-type domain-containing protein n=1 Tax=Tilletia controversa TaxID=13291 RepID=A0A8X7SS66_9BASI|nr:hypothetical protein CF328_g9461 [Tilletia controversa]KAE8237755.1 hypothetical protein A4X06_0g9123 [Tilletia controversa]CAD6924349.1 unnamed protein product [Tilletia controversa]CAD6975100.1 unnamed protein product [Tilletia controversa]CAD6981766.1 unnamed protein product [Tilletia controversa]